MFRMCPAVFMSAALWADTITVSSVISVPSSPSQQVYRDTESLSANYTLLVTGGSGSGIVTPILELHGVPEFCTDYSCIERGEAEATIVFEGLSYSTLYMPSITVARPIGFVFGVPQTWRVSMSAISVVASESRVFPTPVTLQAQASFTGPSACSSISGQALPCAISFVDPPLDTTNVPEPAALLAVGAGLALIAWREARRAPNPR